MKIFLTIVFVFLAKQLQAQVHEVEGTVKEKEIRSIKFAHDRLTKKNGT